MPTEDPRNEGKDLTRKLLSSQDKFEHEVAMLLFKAADKVGAVMGGSIESKQMKISMSKAHDSPHFPFLCHCIVILNILADLRRVDFEREASEAREGRAPGGLEAGTDADIPLATP